MSKMFKSVTRTWNPWVGCRHGCRYCRARSLAEGRLKAQGGKYAKGFEPSLWLPDMKKTFKKGERIFVSFMGDLLGEWVPPTVVNMIIDRTRQFPETDFLFVTKNPGHYSQFSWPENAILGVTLETDGHYPEVYQGDPPPPDYFDRVFAFLNIRHKRKFVSVEPIMKMYQPDAFAFQISALHPELVEVGADNYHNNLPEPSPEELECFLRALQGAGVKVFEKEGLARLKG